MDVLLDCAPDDCAFAQRLAGDLKALGSTVRIVGVGGVEGPSRLATPNLVVPVLSAAAVKSAVLLDRVEAAVRQYQQSGGASVVPVLAGPCAVPGALGLRVPVDFSSSYSVGLAELVERVMGIDSIAHWPPPLNESRRFGARLYDCIVSPQFAADFVKSLSSDEGWRPLLREAVHKCDAFSRMDVAWRDMRAGVDVFFIAGVHANSSPWLVQVKLRRADDCLSVESVESITPVHHEGKAHWAPSLVYVCFPLTHLTGGLLAARCSSTDLWRPGRESLMHFVGWLEKSAPELSDAVSQPVGDARARRSVLIDRSLTIELTDDEQDELSRLEDALDREDESFYAPIGEAVANRNLAAARERHGRLIDKRFTVGLTAQEESELQAIERVLDEEDERYYRPLTDRLRKILHQSG
jgi:hypothetical protein